MFHVCADHSCSQGPGAVPLGVLSPMTTSPYVHHVSPYSDGSAMMHKSSFHVAPNLAQSPAMTRSKTAASVLSDALSTIGSGSKSIGEKAHKGLGRTATKMLAELKNVQDKVTHNQGNVHAMFHTESPTSAQGPPALRFLRKPWFNNLIGFLIICSTVMIGVQAEWESQHIGQATPSFFHWAEVIFCVLFALELFLRLAADGSQFLTCPEWRWNIFDLVIVLASSTEMLLTFLLPGRDFAGFLALRAVKTLRLVRTVRAVRVMKCFRELRLVVYGILSSVSSLFWLIWLLVFFMFMVALFITQTITSEMTMAKNGLSRAEEEVMMYFGGFLPTVYTLYMAISNGISWGVLADALWEVSPSLGVLMAAYIAFAVFAVLNVVTGVFVENANRASAKDSDHCLLEDTTERQKHIEAVVELFHEANNDGSGQLSLKEFESNFLNPHVKAYFRLLDLDIEMISAKKVFHLLDFDGSGYVDIDEFVGGCTRLRGQAKAIDIAMLQSRSNKMCKFLNNLQENLNKLHLGLASMEQRLLTTAPRHVPFEHSATARAAI
eukprot:gnl/MRDRNA2_/MRDRNA2_75441_c0_seq1.p1 gnl/MRDRNA2_/MRDRNA2_75441_c0~~gnl/MRDRNA2_/MRDRNA2_75441_c0_seq1.p1  ORF type:complete len:620 (+),score=98.36 gnl/MRDRNA2_/MRDRNA2_75441_c0_seq1:213-1862(+)